ncbi:hypothetical protein [Pelagicoccus sp. SDUM812005]|uniref:hypothetical protein n=1 Tax=Pelagicoccus sp. SDUM812005 TaxID=3041257 RepID=UPI00280F210D|nr:hypothetical protein [Pelagicoccus sp. SDUM812005]MDQ8180250.1 hypothetical protein [Pelagicoccus sp. SDUM812005]
MKIKYALLGALASSLLIILPAHAGVGPPITEIQGLNGFVDVLEYDDGFQVEYTVVARSPGPVPIFFDFFAISTNSEFGLFYSLNNPSFQPIWNAADWNSSIHAVEFGTFSSLFGSDSHVSVFVGPAFTNWLPEFFLANAAADSEFVVAANGNIIDQSYSASVPDGGTTWLLLGSALFGVFLSRKTLRR